MQALPFATIAFVLYVAAAIWQGMTLFRRVPPRQGMVRLLAVLGLLLHIPVVVKLVGQSPGLLPGFTTSATLLMAVAVNVVLVASLFKPVLNAGIALFPLAGIALLAATWLPNQGGHTGLTPGILLVWAGIILLTLSIASGLIFLDNFFAQHLAHKTVLSLLAWIIFTTLLVGRYRFGWRGMRAVRWTLGGCGLLVLAYFGSKFVLEVVLNR